MLTNRGTLPPSNSIAQLFGGKELTPERSENYSLGVVMNVADLVVTIDVYEIDLRDRITQSANIQLTSQQPQELENQGFSGPSELCSFRFYVNDFATQTTGLDLVTSYAFKSIDSENIVALIYNYNKTYVTYFNPITLDSLRIRQIEESLPKQRRKLTWRHEQGAWRSLLRFNYFGDYWIAHLGEPQFNI
jgi:iron complex outermembrane receptor protein